MAHSYLIFDFGSNEEAAQQARHKVEGWKQGFRLGDKLMVKFDRGDDRGDEKAADSEDDGKDAEAKGRAKSKKKDDASEKETILVMVRLDFSDHEKLSHQRWLDRIPAEALFREAHPKILHQGDAEFASTAERFEDLPEVGGREVQR